VTRAEQLSVGVTGALALAAVSAYAIDACGFGIAAGPVSAVAIAGAAALAWSSHPTGANRTNRADTLLLLAVVGFVFVTILRFGWPALVPPGRGPDLTHHLLLVDYIERHRELVHDRALERSMGEMAHYTPGAHLLAVLLGWWLRVDGLRAFFPLLAACAALASGFVFLIARRLALPAPYALAAVMLLFLPYRYFYGAFTHDAFLAQAVATLFAVASWWALVV